MRIQTLLVLTALLLHLPMSSQDFDYPTLAALEDLEIAQYEYVDMIRRLSWTNADHIPPANPPDYMVGDRETLTLRVGAGGARAPAEMELRGKTANVLIWVVDSLGYSRERSQRLAERVEAEIVAPLSQLFAYSPPPGVDGDPRLTVAIIHNPDFPLPGAFLPSQAIPRAFYPASSQRELIQINLAVLEALDDRDGYIAEIIAHEYQHVFLYHRDVNEEDWVNEAFAGFAEYYTSEYGTGNDSVHKLGDEFLNTPAIGLTHLGLSENQQAKYGAGALFMIYLAEQFGDEVVARLHAESADGWRGIEKVLREYAAVSADEVFADWALANYVGDADRGYGYEFMDPPPTPAQPSATIREFPALHKGSLPQYSAEYLAINVSGAERLSLRLTQEPEAKLIDTAAAEGRFFYYGVSSDSHSSRLTREIDLDTYRSAWLEFRVWYDLTENYEYGYVQISRDGGQTWSILPGNHTLDKNVAGVFYDNGYTGQSGVWLQERMSLARYAKSRILLRFETLSDLVTTYNGLALDDLRIDAIDFFDGFESPDEAWVAEGWIRTDNRLPQRTWLQVVQDDGESLHLTRRLMRESGVVLVDVLPGVSQAHIAISPVVPLTTQETEYSLEINLMDADGAPMSAADECIVTTTHALNFRARPNGNKIGLVPEGAALDALDKEGDWFQVEHVGRLGWIHGDYAHTAGNCP